MPSLNVDIDYFDDPRTKRLVGLLGKGSEVLPLRLWAFCARYRVDGRLTGLSTQEIEEGSRWWGQPGEMIRVFLLPDVAHLDKDQDVLFVPSWRDEQGHLIAYQTRAKAGAKKRWDQGMLGDAPSNAPTTNALLNDTDKKKKNKKEKPTVQIPNDLDSPDFRKAWSDFVEFRESKRKPLTQRAMEIAMEKLSSWGEFAAVQAIKNSIMNDWQGLFPPKNGEIPTNGTDEKGLIPLGESVNKKLDEIWGKPGQPATPGSGPA